MYMRYRNLHSYLSTFITKNGNMIRFMPYEINAD